MGVLDIFDIRVNNSGPILSGATVSGEVLLRLKKEVEIARVMVYLTGAGQVEFEDNIISTSAYPRNTASDKESYLKLTQIVFSKNSSTNPSRIVKNELYQMEFELTLPKKLPSSFMTLIYYKITAFLDCGGKSHDISKPIIVINDFDLNTYDGPLNLLAPIDSWTPSRSKSDTGLVSVRLVLDKRGFAIGEAMSCQLEMYNNSKAKLECINLCLVQKSAIKAFGISGLQMRRTQRLLVRHVALGKLRNAERLVKENITINIPWVVSSDMEKYSRLVDVQYYLQVTTTSSSLSALTGALVNQHVCTGPDFKRTEQVFVLAEEQVVIGARKLQTATVTNGAAIAPAAAAAIGGGGGGIYPTAPPASDAADLTMFTMVPTAPPSYNEALTHEKAPMPAAAAATPPPASAASAPAPAAAAAAAPARSISPSASSESLTQEAA